MPGTTDVLVIGGGPAGLAAAIAARRQGFEVTVVERSRPPIDKACGEGLLPDGVAALREIGVPIEAGHGAPFHGIHFLDPGLSVEARFARQHGVGLRRTTLHRLLSEHAGALGVSLLWGAPVSRLSDDGVEVDGHTIACRWLVGADGQNSLCRKWAGLDHVRRFRRRLGFRRHFRVSHWTDLVEVHWGPACQVYITPVAPGEICVVLIASDPELRFEDLFRLFPAVAARLSAAEASTPVRGAFTSSLALRQVARGNVALVGEAAGSVDAITGDGLTLAFRQAIALGEALARGDMDRYRAAHRRITRPPARMGGLLLAMDRHPRFRRRVLGALASQPALFARLLNVHAGLLAPADLGIASTLRLGWEFLTA